MHRIGYLSSGSTTGSSYLVEAFREGPRELGWVEGRNIAIAAMAREHAEAVLVIPDSLFGNYSAQLADLAAKYRLPSMFGIKTNAEAGGLMSYGANIAYQARRAAVFVDKILKGARPADLPVEQPIKFELVINLKTAKALGLTIPQSLLLRADEVIQ